MRKLATFAFSFSAAIFLGKYAVPFKWLLPLAALFAIAAALSLLLKSELRLRAILISLGLLLGFGWYFAFDSVFIKPFEHLGGQTTVITAEVADYPQKTEYGLSLYIKVKSGGKSAKTLLYADDSASSLAPGDLIETEARISLSTSSYGEETDYYTSKGIFLIAYQRGDIELLRSGRLPVKYYPQFFAKSIKEKINVIYDSGSAPFMLALLTGDRSLLKENDLLTSAMSSTGISHVVAVSGMHISFLVGLIMLLIRRRRLGALICVPIVLVFMATVGNTPSVVRAGVMQVLLLLAPLINRENDPVTTLGTALMLLLLINPYSAGNVGLQLSFAASSGIILLSGRINSFFSGKISAKLFKFRTFRFLWKFTAAVCASSAGALVFTIPLVAVHFSYVSLIAPLTNLLVLWSVTLSFGGGLISVLLGFVFLPIGRAAAWVIAWFVRYITAIVLWLSEFRLAYLTTQNILVRLWLLLLYLVLGWLLIRRKRKPRLVIPACGLIITLCAAVLLSGLGPDTTGMTVTAVDVGQGQSIVITTREHTFVVDCGGNKAANVGNTTADYLRSINRTSIDVLIITHFHGDHVDGITQLMRRENVGLIAVPYIDGDYGYDAESLDFYREIVSIAESLEIDIIFVKENIRLSYKETSLSLFAPVGSLSENERGVTALCTEGDFDVLITGDISGTQERRLLKESEFPDIEVLIVGHHGSKYSTSETLLEVVRPEAAIISVGYNSYGHPAEEVLKRLESKYITVYRTDITGNVTVRSD